MSGDKPWPEVPIGNKDHTNAAVVIIGAGISGKSPFTYLSHLQPSQSSLTFDLSLQEYARQSTS
jgi:L-2-hydroxyglutarate oxidase LhgO